MRRRQRNLSHVHRAGSKAGGTLVGKRGQIKHVRVDHVERVIIRRAALTNATSREPEPKGLHEVIIRPEGLLRRNHSFGVDEELARSVRVADHVADAAHHFDHR
jgi:hypothetical protein